MNTSIEIEKKVINNVVDEFNLKKNSYMNLINNFGLNNGVIGNCMLKESKKMEGKDFLKYGSVYFFEIVKGVLYIPQTKLNYLFKNIIRGVLIDGLKLEKNADYIDNILNYFAGGCLDFINFIKKYGLDEKYFLEYYFACFTSLMLIGLGEINDFVIYDNIVRIWVLVDNMIDNDEQSECILELRNFFESKCWMSKKRLEYFQGKNNPIFECFEVIEKRMTEDAIVKIYKRFWKLYKYDYQTKNKKKENILKYSCLKTRKSLDIFMFAMNVSKKDIKPNKYYNVSLLIQLFDDLMDIKKDIAENNSSIFLQGTKEENTAVVMAMMENFRVYFGELIVFFEMLIMLMVMDNANYFMEEFIEGYRNECEFIDLDKFQMQQIYELVGNTEKMTKLLKIYLG